MSQLNQFKYFTVLTVLYSVFLCCTALITNRIVFIHGVIVSGGSLIIPVSYAIVNISAETYGYRLTRQLIWLGTLSVLLFCSVVVLVNLLPAPGFWHFGYAYNMVIFPLLKTSITYLFANFFGIFVSLYIFSKWRLLAQGRLFFLRCYMSSIVGEVIFVFIGFTVLFSHKLSFDKVLTLMAMSLFSKLIVGLLVTPISSSVAQALKKTEGGILHDETIYFNPFKL